LSFVATESRPDTPRVRQSIAAMHADEERSQLPGLSREAADHDFLAAATLGFCPIADATRAVRRIEPLGNDAFEAHAARRLEHCIASGLEMLDVADRRAIVEAVLVEEGLEACLARRHWPFAQVLAVQIHEIEDEVHDL